MKQKSTARQSIELVCFSRVLNAGMDSSQPLAILIKRE
jgi:hypothetical protein